MSEPCSATPLPPHFSPVLLTDLYALAMLQAYFEEHMSDVAVFSLFVRRSRELAASGDTSTARVMGRALTRR